LIKTVPDFYIPYYDSILKYFEAVSTNILNYRNVNLENIYWYLLFGYYLHIDLKKLKYNDEFFRFIKKCQVETESEIGFRFTPFTQDTPDTWSTSYALVILRLLGRLDEFLIRPEQVDVKKKIRTFIFNNRDNKGHFLHCVKNCPVCKKTSEYKTLFSVLETLLILDETSVYHEKEILPSIAKLSGGNAPKNLFRLLSFKFFSSIDNITSEELEYFLSFQKKDGGFDFTTAVGSVNETFWISYLFENYRFMAEYPRGNAYAYIVQNLKKIDMVSEPKDPLKMMEYAKLVVLLSFVWQNLIDELENIIFHNLALTPMMDINILTLQGGVRNAEYEIIAFINLKYKLTLNIIDNATRFSQFASRLDPIEQFFAKEVYERAKNSVRFDLNELISDYNRRHLKSARIRPEFVIKILNRMMDDNFFKGKIIEKSRLLKKDYFFNREQFIQRIISCNRQINHDDISKEKKKLDVAKEDIYNMTREMRDSSANIMREVESLIFVDEIEYAEQRLKSNIKKALFDAEFFNKNVQQSLDDFEYIKGRDALGDVLKDWEKVYNGLQSDFQNVNTIMLDKIKEGEQLQQQKDILSELENQISRNSADVGLAFDSFSDIVRKTLEKSYTRANIEKLQNELVSIIDKIKNYDHAVIESSQKVVADDNKIRKRRKKIIDTWVSDKENFEQAYSLYYDAFTTWHHQLEIIDGFYNKFMNLIKDIEQRINTNVADKQFDEAFKIIDEGLSMNLTKSIQKEYESLSKEIDTILKKQKKTYLILANLEKELDTQKKKLDETITKIREDLHNQVVVDKNRQLKEDFIRIINEKIDFLDGALSGLELQMQKLLTEQIPNNILVEQQFTILNGNYIEATRAIEGQLKLCEDNIQYFRVQIEPFLTRWQKFQQSFEPRVTELKSSILDDVIKRSLVTMVNRTNSNQVDIVRVADELHMNKKEVRSHIENMLNISKISGDLIEGTCFLVLHNQEWRINKRLRLFVDGELNEMRTLSNRIIQLFDSSVANSTFVNNVKEFKELNLKFNEKCEATDIAIEQHINELKPNRNNVMYMDIMDSYKKEFNSKKEMIANIIIKADKAVDCAQIIEKQVESLKALIELKMHKFDEESEEKKNIEHDKNKIWLKQSLDKLNAEINELKRDLVNKMERTWLNVPASDEIKKELLTTYDTKVNEIMNDYNEKRENLEQKILNFEYQRVRNEIEKILVAKQDLLNNHLGKIQYDVENKIEIKEFKNAMQRLNSKVAKVDELIKTSERELKQKNKLIADKSKVFSVKNKFLLDRWELFVEEYRNIIREKQINLELRIMESYIKMVIKVFKDEYIPFSYLTREFGLKKEVVTERLITLIGERRLTGKIYPEADVYYENDQMIEKIDKASASLIKTSNVQTYLMMTKIRRIFQQYSPILAGFASMLTVIFYLIRILSDTSVTLPWWSLLLIIGIVFVLLMFITWVKKGEKRIKQIEQSNSLPK
jgi:hypothetical protein